MDLASGRHAGRQSRYKADYSEKSYDSNSVPRQNSKHEMNILNIGHGEDPSNYEHRSIMDEEALGHQNPENGKETGDINVDFKRVKNHGLMCPLHPQQVGTWVVMVILVLTFYLFLIPGIYHISAGFSVFICIIYGLLLFGVIIFCLRATLTDPTDRNIVYERECRKEGIEPEENDELEFFCDVCEGYVHDRTKHCGQCNRCTDLFDHHCKWLNNCVGAKNYADFLILISVLLLQTLLFMIISFVFVITALASKSKFQEGFNEYYDSELNRFGLAVFVVLLNILCGLIVYFTVSLIILHIKLRKMEITAYEYIVYLDEREERLELFQRGEMSIGEFEEEEKQAQEDLKKKKKSKIIHQINKENKKAYRERIIARNNKAKKTKQTGQTPAATQNAMMQNQTPKKKQDQEKITKHQSDHKKEEFYNVMQGKKSPERAKKYSSSPNGNGGGIRVSDENIEDVKVNLAQDVKRKRLNFNQDRESSDESGSSKAQEINNRKRDSEKEKSSREIMNYFSDNCEDLDQNPSNSSQAHPSSERSEASLSSPPSVSKSPPNNIGTNTEMSSSKRVEPDFTGLKKAAPSDFSDDPDSS